MSYQKYELTPQINVGNLQDDVTTLGPDAIELRSELEEKRPRSESPSLFLRNLKHHLVLATKQNNKERLESALQNYEDQNGGSVENKVVKMAREKVYILQMKESLKTAISEKDTHKLKEYLRDIRKTDAENKPKTTETTEKDILLKWKNNTIAHQLSFEIHAAQKLLSLDKSKRSVSVAAKTKSSVLNRQAMTDVTSYRNPPQGVHSVIQATLLLFGEDEDLTSDWGKCKALVSPSASNGLLRRLPGLDYQACNPELVARAQQILDEVEFHEVMRSSRSAACFYNYTSAVIDKFIADGKLASVIPANIDRQREILNRPLSARTQRYRKIMEKKEQSESKDGKESRNIIEVRVA